VRREEGGAGGARSGNYLNTALVLAPQRGYDREERSHPFQGGCSGSNFSNSAMRAAS
jgi:hypothetical protein